MDSIKQISNNTFADMLMDLLFYRENKIVADMLIYLQAAICFNPDTNPLSNFNPA